MFGGVILPGGMLSALWKFDPIINQWTWMKGPNTLGSPGIYGVQGVPDPANNPGVRGYGAGTWVDMQGNLWLFGGFGKDTGNVVGALSDLWKYDISTNMWVWVKGPQQINQTGSFGTQGVGSPSNLPPSRGFTSSWVDASGDLWMFGGHVNAYTYPGILGNDVWKYNITLNQWTWMKGSQSVNPTGSYGTLLVPSPSNDPPGRGSMAYWNDGNGNFWIYAGAGATSNAYSDVWKYDMSTNNWTWMNGNSTYDNNGLYLNRCTSNNGNKPSSRFYNEVCWVDSCGNLIMFGGGRGSSFNIRHNDLWNYNTASNLWTWVAGDTVVNGTGSYGTIMVPSASNRPNGRGAGGAFKDINGNFWMFGGIGSNGPVQQFNDMWRFVPDPQCPAGCGLSSVSSSGEKEFRFQVFPNPTSGWVTLESSNKIQELDILDATGRLLYQYSPLENEFRFQLPNQGVYLIKAISESGIIRTKLVIRE